MTAIDRSYKDKTRRHNPIDEHVGHRVRLRRLQLYMSLAAMAEQLQITEKELRQIEFGNQRIGASRLQAISHILKIPVAYFFEDAPDIIKKLDEEIRGQGSGMN